MSLRESLGFLLVILLMMGCLWPGFGEVFLHPNGFLFADSGDGLKNYFNLGYYLKYNTGLQFTGVNYPYGDHLLYTDTHPLLAWFLNLLDNNVADLAQNSVGIINLCILMGMIVCGLVLYLILRHYRLPIWYAAIMAVLIALLSPQWDRIHGHLSLSYGFILPLFWYILIRYEQATKKTLWWILLFIYTLAIGGIHVYYVAICAAFLLAFILTKAVKNGWALSRAQLSLALSVILPLVLFQVFSATTDTITDRPVSPYGFYQYHATLGSVFLPYVASSSDFIGQISNPDLSWEGRAFVGTPVLLFLLGTLVFFGHKILKKDAPLIWQLPAGLALFLWASVLVLIFSMCIPFKWGLQFLTEIISPLKQFRALGRFSWIFYYVSSICAALTMYKMFEVLKKTLANWYGFVFIAFILLLWGFDAGSFFLNHGPVTISKNDRLKNSDTEFFHRFRESNTDFKSFQAIISCPLVAVRTDKMTFESDLAAHNEAMVCAFYTGLPLIQSSASRPSLSQTLSSIQLFSSPNIAKKRLLDMHPEQPILLIHHKHSPLSHAEERLRQKANVFWQDENVSYASLMPSVFADSLQIHKQNASDSSLFRHQFEWGKMACRSRCDGVFFDSYEDEFEGSTSFFGQGSRYSKARELILFDSTFSVPDSIPYQASFWVYIDPSFSGMPAWEYLHGTSRSDLASSGWQPTREITEVYNQWVRVSFPLEKGPHHKIVLHGKKSTADNLLLKPKNHPVYISNDDAYLYNNYFLDSHSSDEE